MVSRPRGPGSPPARGSRLARAVLAVALALTAPLLAACAPIVRPANFAGARDVVTDASLLGPFDGQVVDAATSEPIAEATVVAVWAYDRGDGFIGPWGSETTSVTTDAAGRYRIPPAKLTVRASTARLVDAYLIVYKRGYAGYRSDTVAIGGPRSDFTVRHNRVELRKWQNSDSHAEHLLFLAPPRPLHKAVRWEAEIANLDLFRALGGAGGPAVVIEEDEPGQATAPVVAEVLDASGLLTPDEVRQRTGYTEAFEVKDLADLKRTGFYHGVHLQATDSDERHDLALRVWSAPPGGMDPVAATIQETFGKVKPAGDITPETWSTTADGVHAIGFVDRQQKIGVLLTCGDQQCHDLDTALILAKHVYRNLDRLKAVADPNAGAAPAAPAAPDQPSVPSGAVPGRPAAPTGAGASNPAGVASPKGQGNSTMSPESGPTTGGTGSKGPGATTTSPAPGQPAGKGKRP
ncbi:carboxypeptidase-like regulatory domain-containing protein [Nannocystis bainbridge]|uniref:Carboxypeptidase-like regulatory domain-containing protein n=1 Tax=Nannocystis bainbridge TaxID=2995303 RepID=A0ABT5DPC3_9BACT|nr:carboxypeptidase-like regulatory domain-containing protein [Nannocystis bainbridge]MDC0715386.1 carboxypeptidase-like regulatory domain-containing protein [Nannocystis bainbridge]